MKRYCVLVFCFLISRTYGQGPFRTPQMTGPQGPGQGLPAQGGAPSRRPGVFPGPVMRQGPPGFPPTGPVMPPMSPMAMMMASLARNPNNFRYATCTFNDTWTSVKGRVDFRQFLIGEGRQQVQVRVQLAGLPVSSLEAERGIHVHEFGDTGDRCSRVGPHFNPDQTPHGSQRNFAYLRHAGDLGNIRQSTDGLVSTQFVDQVISLDGANDIVGRAFVIKVERDDEGQGDTRDSRVNGNTRTPIACCVVGRTTAANWYNPLTANDIQNMAATGLMPENTVDPFAAGRQPGPNNQFQQGTGGRPQGPVQPGMPGQPGMGGPFGGTGQPGMSSPFGGGQFGGTGPVLPGGQFGPRPLGGTGTFEPGAGPFSGQTAGFGQPGGGGFRGQGFLTGQQMPGFGGPGAAGGATGFGQPGFGGQPAGGAGTPGFGGQGFGGQGPTGGFGPQQGGGSQGFQGQPGFGATSGMTQSSFGQGGMTQGGFGQGGSSQSGFGQGGMTQGGFGQGGSSQSGFGQGGPSQPGMAQQGSGFGQGGMTQQGFGGSGGLTQSGFGSGGLTQTGFGEGTGSQGGLTQQGAGGAQQGAGSSQFGTGTFTPGGTQGQNFNFNQQGK